MTQPVPTAASAPDPERPHPDRIEIAQVKLTEGEIEAAVRVLRSGRLIQGAECEAFEREFAAKVGARFCFTNGSGTAALHLAYLACLKPGDEVLVPSFTFFATASMVTAVGARPVFCDVDAETFLLDLKDAERKVTPRTRAIAPVHLFGNVCDVDAVRALAGRHQLRIVWDAAQAHGSAWRGADVGSLGDLVTYSFYPSKNLFVGEGGMTLTDSPEFAERIKFMRAHGQTGRYLHTMLGYNYRMTDVEAAIGREQLKRLDAMLAVRRRNAAILGEGLAGLPGLAVQRITAGVQSAWHQFCVVIDEARFGCGRDALADRLKAQGIGTAVHYPRGLHQQPIFQELYGKLGLPRTEALAERILALPVHHGVTEQGARRIVQAVRAAAGGG